MIQEITVKAIGYWAMTPDDPDFVHPALVLGSDIAPDISAKIASYLRKGAVQDAQLGWAICRFADGPHGREMGCKDLTDGIWVWPEGLAVYVERYNVKLPEEFIHHLTQQDFDPTLPDNLKGLATYSVRTKKPGFETIEEISYRVDFSFWRKWCNTMKTNYFERQKSMAL
jgi:hypothetical protein